MQHVIKASVIAHLFHRDDVFRILDDGQAGSLLLWAWILGVLALVVRSRAAGDAPSVAAFGLLMGFLCFLTATMR